MAEKDQQAEQLKAKNAQLNTVLAQLSALPTSSPNAHRMKKPVSRTGSTPDSGRRHQRSATMSGRTTTGTAASRSLQMKK